MLDYLRCLTQHLKWKSQESAAYEPGKILSAKSSAQRSDGASCVFLSCANSRAKGLFPADALEFLGGIFGLFVALHALIFGHRPSSPWGIIYRWSSDHMKRPLSRELASRFDLLRTPVLLMYPAHRRFYLIDVKNYSPRQVENNDDLDAEDNGSLRSSYSMTAGPRGEDWNGRQRIKQVEERMQLLELVFKSYYIDDELFQRLD